MSHIHIPDGVMPAWIILAGWLATAALLALAVRSAERTGVEARLPLVGVMAALMLAGMSLELLPIGYHINLTVISGIFLGPALGLVAAFITNLVLASFGHSGITVVGLNTLVLGTEVVLGYYLFRSLRALLGKRAGIWLAAGGATVMALFFSTLMMIGIVGLSSVNPGLAAPQATAVEPGTLSFRFPWAEGVVSWEPFGEAEQAAARPSMDLALFARLVLGLGAVGWVIEAFLTGLIARYVARVRPDLLQVPPSARGQ